MYKPVKITKNRLLCEKKKIAERHYSMAPFMQLYIDIKYIIRILYIVQELYMKTGMKNWLDGYTVNLILVRQILGIENRDLGAKGLGKHRVKGDFNFIIIF